MNEEMYHIHELEESTDFDIISQFLKNSFFVLKCT